MATIPPSSTLSSTYTLTLLSHSYCREMTDRADTLTGKSVQLSKVAIASLGGYDDVLRSLRRYLRGK